MTIDFDVKMINFNTKMNMFLVPYEDSALFSSLLLLMTIDSHLSDMDSCFN